jgi:hypothetical protein
MVLPGKPAPELPTDQQCENCGRFFGLSGIESHRESCPVKESDSVVIDVHGEMRTHQCSDCGVWATTEGTEHLEDCSLNRDVPDWLGPAHSVLVPFDLPDVSETG